MKNKRITMKNSKIIKDMKKYRRWKRKGILKMLALAVGIAMIPFLFLLLEERFGSPEGGAVPGVEENADTRAADAAFAGCNLIERSCTTDDCVFYASCLGQQAMCRVYDCGSQYGIYLKRADGQSDMRTELKPDLNYLAAEAEACSGSVEVVDQGCKDGVFSAQVKVTPRGECRIGSFIVAYAEDGAQSNDFKRLEDGTYEVSVRGCGQLEKITPVAEDGMSFAF